MRADEAEAYMDTDGRMSDMALGRVRVRGESDVSTITGISSSCSSVCVLPWPDDTADDVGEVCADELELAMLVALSVSVSDLLLSRPCLCRNLLSFDPGDDGCGGALRDCRDMVVLAVDGRGVAMRQVRASVWLVWAATLSTPAKFIHHSHSTNIRYSTHLSTCAVVRSSCYYWQRTLIAYHHERGCAFFPYRV